jgi:regulator of replication initiation timing
MKEPIIKLSLKDYEELKQFKDNFHKKNFVAVYGVEYTTNVFYSDEEMNKALMTQITELGNENAILKSENSDLKNDLQNKIEKSSNYGVKYEQLYFRLKQMNLFQFLKFKKTL